MEGAISTSFPPIGPEGPDVFLDRLLHPARHFERPQDVLTDATLDVQEKRAILSSWASDACAVESVPALRMPPGATEPVSSIGTRRSARPRAPTCSFHRAFRTTSPMSAKSRRGC
ncbi:hypothetical protein NKJ50_30620 [Mesorhizobium sp. M0115]|uniref:hypothetical protein n=1 Tax=Mesorhizobium sp. M0115 TaxID=2956883 RepID=UPI00333D5F35